MDKESINQRIHLISIRDNGVKERNMAKENNVTKMVQCTQAILSMAQNRVKGHLFIKMEHHTKDSLATIKSMDKEYSQGKHKDTKEVGEMVKCMVQVEHNGTTAMEKLSHHM